MATMSALAATAGTLLFPAAVVYAGLMDLVTLKIRNVLVLVLGAAWLVLAPLAGFTMPGDGLERIGGLPGLRHHFRVFRASAGSVAATPSSPP